MIVNVNQDLFLLLSSQMNWKVKTTQYLKHKKKLASDFNLSVSYVFFFSVNNGVSFSLLQF